MSSGFGAQSPESCVVMTNNTIVSSNRLAHLFDGMGVPPQSAKVMIRQDHDVAPYMVPFLKYMASVGWYIKVAEILGLGSPESGNSPIIRKIPLEVESPIFDQHGDEIGVEHADMIDARTGDTMYDFEIVETTWTRQAWQPEGGTYRSAQTYTLGEILSMWYSYCRKANDLGYYKVGDSIRKMPRKYQETRSFKGGGRKRSAYDLGALVMECIALWMTDKHIEVLTNTISRSTRTKYIIPAGHRSFASVLTEANKLFNTSKEPVKMLTYRLANDKPTAERRLVSETGQVLYRQTMSDVGWELTRREANWQREDGDTGVDALGLPKVMRVPAWSPPKVVANPGIDHIERQVTTAKRQLLFKTIMESSRAAIAARHPSLAEWFELVVIHGHTPTEAERIVNLTAEHPLVERDWTSFLQACRITRKDLAPSFKDATLDELEIANVILQKQLAKQVGPRRRFTASASK